MDLSSHSRESEDVLIICPLIRVGGARSRWDHRDVHHSRTTRDGQRAEEAAGRPFVLFKAQGTPNGPPDFKARSTRRYLSQFSIIPEEHFVPKDWPLVRRSGPDQFRYSTIRYYIDKVILLCYLDL